MKTKQESSKETVRFTRQQLLASQRYAAVRDTLCALLKEGESYTLGEVDRNIEAFRKRRIG